MKTLNDLINTYGLDKLNTFTKYPSILTYHDLGDRGTLKESHVEDKTFFDIEKCYLTEKIDGTNSRIVVCHDDYIIGSREDILYAKGDRIGNPALNIANTIKHIAESMTYAFDPTEGIFVLYVETYGGNVTSNSKQYTNDKTYGFRVFDISYIGIEETEAILNNPIDKISSWREHGGQHFYNVDIMKVFAKQYGVETVPYIDIVNGKTIPLTLSDTFDWLQQFATTKAGINETGHAEGVVVRNFDRSLIRKIRFEDYERTKKQKIF
jgi:hypothetical protein